MTSNSAPEINLSLVKRLISGQFPQWTDLSLEPFNSSGTENVIYRLGEDMFVRLPRGDWAIQQVEKEQRWLPFLAPHLPITIPTALAFGVPAEGYPWRWSVYRWIKGENALWDTLTIHTKRQPSWLESREMLRAAQSVDGATWARGRGWALSVGLTALPYYQISNPVFASVARRLIDEVLADYKKGV